MFASSAARLPKDENEEDILGDIGTPSPPETPPVDDSVAPQPAQVPVIDGVPPGAPADPANDTTLPPPADGTTTPDETLDTTIADAGAGSDLGPPATKPLPDLTPPVPTTPHQLENAKLEDAAVTATQNESLVKQRGLQEEEKLRARQAVDADKHAAAVQKVIEDHEKNLQALLQKKQEYFDAARNAPFHDLYAERSTGDRILGAVAIFLGGLGGGQNQAMQILDNRMKHAYDKQAADIEGKWKLYGEQSKNIEEAERGKNDAIGNLKLLQSARYEAAADQLVDLKVRQGIPLEQAKADKDVVEVRQKAADIRMTEAEKATKEAEQKTKDDLEKRLKESEIRKNDAQAGKLERKGSGSGAPTGALSELIKMKEEGKPDSAIAARADELHVPQKTWGPAVKEVRVSTGQNTRLGITEDKQVSKEANDWAKANGLPAIEKQQRELGELHKVLADNPSNPLAQALAVEKAVSAARGGAASKQALSLALGHLGGSLDSAEGVIQKWRDGQLSEGQRKNFINFLNGQRAASAAAGKEKYDAYNKFVDAAPEEKRKDLLTGRSKLFSGFEGFGGPEKQKTSEGGATKVRDVVVPADHGEAADKLQRAKAAAADPSRSAAARRVAQDYIDKYVGHATAFGAR